MTRIAARCERRLGDAFQARARQASPRTALRRFGHSVPIAIAAFCVFYFVAEFAR
jgi:hypothetical protein